MKDDHDLLRTSPDHIVRFQCSCELIMVMYLMNDVIFLINSTQN